MQNSCGSEMVRVIDNLFPTPPTPFSASPSPLPLKK